MYYTYSEDGNLQINQKTIFRNDSVISYSELKNEEVSFPIIKTDSTLIIKQLRTIEPLKLSIEEKEIINIFTENNENINYEDVSSENDSELKKEGYNLMNKRDTIIVDTLLYDFKYVLGIPILALKKLDIDWDYFNYNNDYLSFSSPFESYILFCKDDNVKINETNNFLTNIDFEIGGFSIGDTLANSLVTDIEDWGGKCITANLIANKNIHLELINEKIIYSIERSNIKPQELYSIIEVINEKVKIEAETFTDETNNIVTESYIWRTSGINIVLEKENWSQFYREKSINEKDNYLKKYYLDLSNEDYNYWTLKYQNYTLQYILDYVYRKDKTK
jgi:hypothetical protein